jgi:hypothetical protein
MIQPNLPHRIIAIGLLLSSTSLAGIARFGDTVVVDGDSTYTVTDQDARVWA